MKHPPDGGTAHLHLLPHLLTHRFVLFSSFSLCEHDPCRNRVNTHHCRVRSQSSIILRTAFPSLLSLQSSPPSSPMERPGISGREGERRRDKQDELSSFSLLPAALPWIRCSHSFVSPAFCLDFVVGLLQMYCPFLFYSCCDIALCSLVLVSFFHFLFSNHCNLLLSISPSSESTVGSLFFFVFFLLTFPSSLLVLHKCSIFRWDGSVFLCSSLFSTIK